MLSANEVAERYRSRFGEIMPAVAAQLETVCPIAESEAARLDSANVGTWLAAIRAVEIARRAPVYHAARRRPDKPEELTPDERECRALCFRLGRERTQACAERAGVEITPELDGGAVARLLPELRTEAADLDAWQQTPPTLAERERARVWIRDIAGLCQPKRVAK